MPARPISRLCVFCGSKHGIRPEFAAAARDLGVLLAEEGVALVYGGGRVGLMGVMADAVLESVRLLARATGAFTKLCLDDMQPGVEACEATVEKSLSLATGLNPYIGYEAAAALAKEAFQTGKTIRELCREKNVLPEEQLDRALDPWRMTRPE